MSLAQFLPWVQRVRVSAQPLLAAPCCVLDWQICMSQVGKDTEAQAFLGKLDTDREVGGMVYAAVALAAGASFGGLLLSFHADVPSGPAVVMMFTAAPNRAKAPTISRSLKIPTSAPVGSSTGAAPILWRVNSPAISARLWSGRTDVTVPPLWRRIAAIVMIGSPLGPRGGRDWPRRACGAVCAKRRAKSKNLPCGAAKH